jgi:sugar O-acyltransferase (sialic acid O-acetyltransferase NeuD family)
MDLVILGAGGNAFDVLDIVEAINAGVASPVWRIAGFLDDTRPAGTKHYEYEILGRLREATQFSNATFIECIGSDKSFRRRPSIIEATGLRNEQFATLVHPRASVSPRAKLGRGVYVSYGCCIGGNVTIGNHVLICPGVIIGHDTVVGDYTVLAPGSLVSGFVNIGRNCYIGARSAIRQQQKIGAEVLVGIGAVVVRDVEAGATVVGNPARVLVRKERVTV